MSTHLPWEASVEKRPYRTRVNKWYRPTVVSRLHHIASVWFQCPRFSPDNSVHFAPQVLHRQRSDDRSSRLGDVPVRSGDGAGRLMDYTKVDFHPTQDKPLTMLSFHIRPCLHPCCCRYRTDEVEVTWRDWRAEQHVGATYAVAAGLLWQVV